ncbi:hypothetical protein DEO72_LG7g1313 [Vigna unguiculata]|uniref:Uncharacterized protein n=1 Tax=Vigna unguiculata TaxID=3917 RepID=A0A4D6MJ67_VIGUN|nr:hypothetical protein DEO72_LG7g1313 [Vigna unguiculata]
MNGRRRVRGWGALGCSNLTASGARGGVARDVTTCIYANLLRSASSTQADPPFLQRTSSETSAFLSFPPATIHVLCTSRTLWQRHHRFPSSCSSHGCTSFEATTMQRTSLAPLHSRSAATAAAQLAGNLTTIITTPSSSIVNHQRASFSLQHNHGSSAPHCTLILVHLRANQQPQRSTQTEQLQQPSSSLHGP